MKFKRSVFIAASIWLVASHALQLIAQQETTNTTGAKDYLAHLAAANSALRLNEAVEARRWLDQIPVSARGWEWQLLNARSDSSVQRLNTENWTAVRLDMSRDGQWLVAAGGDGWVRILDPSSLAEVKSWRVADQAVYAARFDPLAEKLAVCSRDGQISVWSIAQQAQIWSQKSGGEGLADLAFSPDGKQLLFCSWFRGPQGVLGLVSTWDPAVGQQTWKTEFGVKPIVAARYSPDGKYFAVGNWDAQVGVWKTDAANEPQVLDFADRAQYSAIDDIAFSPDSQRIAAATKNGTPRIWTLDGSQPPLDLVGHDNAVFSLAFTSDGNSLLTGGSDGVVGYWDLDRRVQSHRYFGHSNRIVSLVVQPGTSRFITASADKSLRIWDLDDSKTYSAPEASKYAYGMVLANQDQLLVAGGLSQSALTIWDVHSKQPLRQVVGPKGGINFLASDGGNWVAGGNWGGDVIVWEVDSGNVIRQMGSPELGGMHQCAISPDRRWLAVATNKKQVVVWDLKSGELARQIPMPQGCWALDFASDGQSLAVGDDAGKVHWISVQSWEPAWSLVVGTAPIRALEIDRSGNWLATGDESGAIAIVDVGQQRIKHQLAGHSERIWTLAISPDDQILVSGSADRRVKTWDPEIGVSRLTISDFSDVVYNLAFSADGRALYVNCPGAPLVKLSID